MASLFPHRHGAISERLRTTLYVLGRLPGLNALGNYSYHQIARACQKEMLKLDGIGDFQLRKNTQRFVPAVSDLDFTLDFDCSDPYELASCVSQARVRYLRLQKQLWLPGEVVAFTPSLRRLFNRYPSSLGWMMGTQQNHASELSQLGLTVQFYLQALHSFRKNVQFGNNSFHAASFRRELRKALRALDYDPDASLDFRILSKLMSRLDSRLQISAAGPVENPHLSPLTLTLSEHWIAKFEEFAGIQLSATNLPFVFLISENEDLEQVFTSFGEFLVQTPSIGLSIPATPVSPKVYQLIQSGYVGWAQTTARNNLVALDNASHDADKVFDAFRERVVMHLAILLGECVYASSNKIRHDLENLCLEMMVVLLRRITPNENLLSELSSIHFPEISELHEFARREVKPTPEPLCHRIALAIDSLTQRFEQNLSLSGFGSKVGEEYERPMSPSSELNGLPEHLR